MGSFNRPFKITDLKEVIINNWGAPHNTSGKTCFSLFLVFSFTPISHETPKSHNCLMINVWKIVIVQSFYSTYFNNSLIKFTYCHLFNWSSIKNPWPNSMNYLQRNIFFSPLVRSKRRQNTWKRKKKSSYLALRTWTSLS